MKVLQEAIAALRELPEDQQATLARAILTYAATADDIYVLSEDDWDARLTTSDPSRAIVSESP